MRDGVLGSRADVQPSVLGCAESSGPVGGLGSRPTGPAGRPKTPRERMYLEAVAALYRDAGAGSKSDRDEAFKEAMRAVYEQYPDDETKLFYGLSILGTIREGTPGFAEAGGGRQAVRRGVRSKAGASRGLALLDSRLR